MIYPVSIITALLTTLGFFLYMKRSGYFRLTDNPPALAAEDAESPTPEEETKDPVSAEDTPAGEEETHPLQPVPPAVYTKKQSLLFTLLFLAMSVVLHLLIYRYSYTENAINLVTQPLIFPKLAILHMICGCAALTDYKRCKIPNKLLLIGVISRAVLYIPEFLLTGEFFKDILINDGLGFVLGFVVLFVVAVITKGGIGFGDVKLFGVIGIMAGSGGVFTILFLSLLFSSIASVLLLLLRKKTIHASLPMAPFIYGGFAAAMILGVF